jgi:tetratricopeptide (TPR) repeat protein
MSDTFTGETYNTLCIDAEGYLAKDSPEQARELLQKAISLIATRPRARSILADTCMSMELWSEARSQLEVLLTLDEGNIGNNFKLAQVLEELGEYQLAMDNYTVVLDDEPDHHEAKVAIKRIETRTKDSWVNLTDIFDTRKNDDPAEIDNLGEKDEFKDGMQVFPDVQSEGLFADSEDEEGSVERLLKNIGLSGDSVEELDDSSELLENIGVSTSETLQSAFADSEDSEEKRKRPVTSLEEIFGASVVAEEEVTELEPEDEEPEELKEETEPEAEEPEELKEEIEPEAEKRPRKKGLNLKL